MISTKSGQVSGQQTPTVNTGNIDKRYEYPLLFEEGKGSNLIKQQIPIPGQENELIPQGGPAIRVIQEKGTVVEIYQKINYPYTRYPMRNTIGIPKPHGETHLAQTQFSIQKDGHHLT